MVVLEARRRSEELLNVPALPPLSRYRRTALMSARLVPV
jgi:hypothetical protein